MIGACWQGVELLPKSALFGYGLHVCAVPAVAEGHAVGHQCIQVGDGCAHLPHPPPRGLRGWDWDVSQTHNDQRVRFGDADTLHRQRGWLREVGAKQISRFPS